MDVDMLSVLLYTFDVLSEMSGHLRGVGVNSDLVPLFSLLFLAGGVIFWLGVVLAIVVGVYRGLSALMWWIVDMTVGKSAESEVFDPQS